MAPNLIGLHPAVRFNSRLVEGRWWSNSFPVDENTHAASALPQLGYVAQAHSLKSYSNSTFRRL